MSFMSGHGVKEKEKIQDLENRLKRALADYANLQKRVEEERVQVLDLAKGALLTKLLPVLDTMEKAVAITKNEGLDLALRQFKKVLEEEGVEEIETKGGFDPRIHEAVEVVKGRPNNKIAAVLVKGYKLGEKILRPAKVRVAVKEMKIPAAQASKEIGSGDYM